MKVTFWLLVAIGAVYALYTGGVAAYSYFQVKAIVEETLVERAKVDRYERADRVKQDILRRRRRAVSPSTSATCPSPRRTGRCESRSAGRTRCSFTKARRSCRCHSPTTNPSRCSPPAINEETRRGLANGLLALGSGFRDHFLDADAVFAGRYHGDEL